MTTYRPNINKHFSQTPASFPIRPNGGQGVRRRKRPNLNNPDSEVFAPSESRRQPNRRIDYDDDVYDYDVNAFDNQDMDLYYKCKQKALMRGRSLKNNEDMPSFEHFPKRDILKNRYIIFSFFVKSIFNEILFLWNDNFTRFSYIFREFNFTRFFTFSVESVITSCPVMRSVKLFWMRGDSPRLLKKNKYLIAFWIQERNFVIPINHRLTQPNVREGQLDHLTVQQCNFI